MGETNEFIFPDETPHPPTPSSPSVLPVETPTAAKPVAPTPVAPIPEKPIQPAPGTTSGVSADLPDEARALLDTIAGTEARSYDLLYGGARFTNYSDHPRKPQPIPSGPNAGKTSTAAGRYQFLADTWDKQAAKLGLKDFSPASQDRAGWGEAQDAYSHATGRDLLSDLKAGKLDAVGKTLSGVWTSLPGGIEQGTSSNSFAARYAKALQDPSKTPAPLWADADLLPGYRTTDPIEKRHSFFDAVQGQLRYETTLGILSDRLGAKHFAPEPFAWTPDLVNNKLGEFDRETQDYIRNTAVSPEHIDYLRDKALDRLDADKALAAQGFMGAANAALGAGLVDLPAWVAGGFAGKAFMGARQLGYAMRIAKTGAVFAASDVPLEAAKYALDYKYDAGDVARGIGTAALFGGGFGALGEIGGAYAARFRKIADAGDTAPTLVSEAAPLDESTVEAAKKAYGSAVGAEVASPEAFAIEPTRMDRFARWLGGWADFSVGGKLYHSENDMISELAPKLTTVATQDLTTGARAVEGALDFVRRTSAAYNARVEHALEKWYGPWADAQGLNAWEKSQRTETFFEMASALHTDPNWQNSVNVDKNVLGFVTDMRKLFADHLEQAKAYGVERAAELQPDELYLPRYFNREAWRAKRLEHGIEGIEDVVQSAVKAANPQIAQRVGRRVVARAAEKDAEQATKRSAVVGEDGKKTVPPNPVEARAKAEAAPEMQRKVREAKADAEVGIARLQEDRGAPSRGEDYATQDINVGALKESVAEEVQRWRQVEADTRKAVEDLPTLAGEMRAKLEAEANDIRDFHQRLESMAEDAFQEARARTANAWKDTEAGLRIERDVRIESAKREAKLAADEIVRGVKVREFLEAFNKRLAVFEEKFTRRVARKYVETVDRSIEGAHPDIDRSLSVRDTELLREALMRQGVVVDMDTADALADMIAPRAQRGPSNLRRRTTLDEHTPFTPAGAAETKAFSMRDLMEKDYEKIVDRYSRSMAPHYIMSSHGFQTESAARKYVTEVTVQHKGIDGYTDSHAYRDRKRANYLLDLIYGKDPLANVDPKWRAMSQVISNLSYARVGGSFGMAQTYDSAELVLRHGFESFMRGVPAASEMMQVIKHGGPEADALVRDLQIFAGLGVKGLEARIVPKFQGLDSHLADDLTGTRLKKAMRVSKSLSNAVGHISGLNTLTDVQHLAAGRMFLQTIADVHSGLRTVEPRLLADFGLSPENLQKFGALLEHAKKDSAGIIENLNSALLRKIDLKTFDEMMGLTRREAFRTIIEPSAGLMPMFAGSTVFGKFAAQLKSFAMVSNSAHSIGNFRLGPAYVAKSVIGGAAWSTALYTMWTHFKAIGKNDEERETYLEKAFAPDKLAFNVWSRVGMAGITPEIMGTGLAVGQKLGVLPQSDEGSNYGQAAKASGLVSGGVNSIPVVDMMGSILDSMAAVVDGVKNERGLTRGEVRKLISIFPLQNALGVSQALNAMTTNLPAHRQ